jgi:hypothetical protein
MSRRLGFGRARAQIRDPNPEPMERKQETREGQALEIERVIFYLFVSLLLTAPEVLVYYQRIFFSDHF